MIKRQMETKLVNLATKFPVVSVIGPRQSGKTTLVRVAFPQKSYVSLEDPDTREFASSDPRGFLASYPDGAIFDEIQRTPDLFSYMQTIVDNEQHPGFYILTGSNNYLLQPHHANFKKRLVKSPKLYFYDPGLLSSLLGIESEKQLSTHYLIGNIFKTMIISELLKYRLNMGLQPHLYFWRDSSGNEIDCLLDSAGSLRAVEIKAGKTVVADYFKGLNYWRKLAGDETVQTSVIYGGNEMQKRAPGNVISWRNAVSVYSE